MFFQHRPVSITPIDDAGELAEKLIDLSWTSCTAFDLGGIVFVNDQTCADGAGEWAVVMLHPDLPRFGWQTNSITFGWMKSPEEALEVIIAELTDSPGRDPAYQGTFAGAPAIALLAAPTTLKNAKVVTLPEHPTGSCYLCA